MVWRCDKALGSAGLRQCNNSRLRRCMSIFCQLKRRVSERFALAKGSITWAVALFSGGFSQAIALALPSLQQRFVKWPIDDAS